MNQVGNQESVEALSPEISIVPMQTFLERHGISYLKFGFLTLVALFLVYQVIGGLLTALFFGFELNLKLMTPDAVFGLRLGTGLSQIALLLVPTLLIARLATFSPREFLRWKSADALALVLPIVGIFALQQLLQMYLIAQSMIPLPASLESTIEPFKKLIEGAYEVLVTAHSLPELLFVIFIIAIIPAFAEEVLFRGLIQRSFERALTPTKGMILAGVIFGAYHLNPFGLIPLIILGIYLGFIAQRANSLFVSIAAHCCNNAFACLAVYLREDPDATVFGNPQEMSVGVMIASVVCFSLVFVLSTYYFIQVTRQPTSEVPVGV